MRILLLYLCLLCPPRAAAEDLAAAVRARLADAPLLRGEFAQSKSVAGFSKPLRSSGTFVLAAEQGVIWHTRAPFPSTLVIGRTRLLSQQPDGRVTLRLDAADQPAVRALGTLLTALLRGDLASLSAQFRVEGGHVEDERWQLQLVPVAAEMQRLFQRVTLAGDRYVRGVELLETSGDRTQIRFEGLATVPPLGAEERSRFD